MKIAGYIKTTLIDWPGMVASEIFCLGCNFKCPFCHNGELVNNKKIKLIDENEILNDLKNRKKWIDGVVISGGEPTIQKDLDAFLEKIKKMGYQIKLDTNGNKPDILEVLIKKKLVDYVAIDIKNCFEKYKDTVGVEVDIKKIKRSMEILKKSNIEYEFRTTLVPGLHDLGTVKNMAEEIKRSETKWYLQNFQPKGCLNKKYLKKKSFTVKEMKEFIKEAKKTIKSSILR